MTINSDSQTSQSPVDSHTIVHPVPKRKNSLLNPYDIELPRARSTPPSPSFIHQAANQDGKRSLDISLNVTEWSRKKFHELQTYGCAWLLEQGGDINQYTSEDFEQISCMQHRVHHIFTQKRVVSPEDLELYKLFSRLFDTSYEQAKESVKIIRKRFTEAFYPVTAPTYDSETGIVTLNYDQLDFAQKLIKEAYPGFFALSQNPKQNLQVAHIAQLLVLGEKINRLPPTAEAFEVREIGSKWGNDIFSFPVLKKSSRLLDLSGKTLRDQVDLSVECREAVNLLIKEFIEGDQSLVIGEYSTSELNRDEKSLATFLSHFSQTIVEHIRKVESTHPGNTFVEIQQLCKNLSRVFSTQEDAKSIIGISLQFLHSDEIKQLVDYKPQDLPIEINIAQQAILLKFIEFSLFLRSNYEDKIHKQLEAFYSDYVARAKVGEKGEHVQLRRARLSYSFDTSLKPKLCEVHHQVYFPSPVANLLSLSENYGGNVPIGNIVSTIEFGKNPNSLFYLNSAIPTKDYAFKQCLWNWRTPERLIEHTLKKICPKYYSKSLKKQLNDFFSNLKELIKIQEEDQLTISEDLKISISSPEKKGWTSTLSSYLWSSSDSESDTSSSYHINNDLTVERLKTIIDEGLCLYEEYTRRQKLLKASDENPTLMISYQLANLLEGSIAGCNRYISTQINEGNTGVKEAFTPLINYIHDEILTKLPSASSSTIEGIHQPRGLVSNIKYGVMESNNGHDIEWKVIRYQSMLRQLQIGLKPIIAREFDFTESEDPIQQFLSQDYENPGVKLLQVLIDDLYNNIDLTITDPKQFTQFYLKSLRKAYSNKFILKLRECSDSLDERMSGQGIRCIRKICFFLYTGINLEPECLALNQRFYDLGRQLVEHDPSIVINDSSTKSYLLERIDTLHYFFHEVGSNHKAPEISRWFKSLKDHWNFAFDPNTEGNLPHKQGQVLATDGKKQKTTNSIACGSTTVEGWISYAQKNQEFLRAMEEYREREMRHVFVINQDLREGSWLKRLKGGVETDRINAILGISEGLEDTFFPVVLSKNSAFFRQCGEFENMSNAEEFKTELINQHFEIPPSVSGNFIPPHVMKMVPDIEEQSKIWVEFIHSIMFYGKTDLSVEERQIFYDLFQDILVIYLIVNLDADSYNISCRDAIDRAADSNSRLWVHLGLVHNMEKEPRFRQRYEAFLLSRAIMTRKRRTILERVDRNKQAVGYYESHKKALQKLHQAIFKTVTIEPINK